MSRFSQIYGSTGIRALLHLHGELVTFHPARGGTPRTVTVIIRDESDQRESLGETVDQVQRIEVVALRDESDASYGGIARLNQGDRIDRAAADPQDKTWTWGLETPSRTETTLTARFVRGFTAQVGTSQTR